MKNFLKNLKPPKEELNKRQEEIKKIVIDYLERRGSKWKDNKDFIDFTANYLLQQGLDISELNDNKLESLLSEIEFLFQRREFLKIMLQGFFTGLFLQLMKTLGFFYEESENVNVLKTKLENALNEKIKIKGHRIKIVGIKKVKEGEKGFYIIYCNLESEKSFFKSDYPQKDTEEIILTKINIPIAISEDYPKEASKFSQIGPQYYKIVQTEIRYKIVELIDSETQVSRDLFPLITYLLRFKKSMIKIWGISLFAVNTVSTTLVYTLKNGLSIRIPLISSIEEELEKIKNLLGNSRIPLPLDYAGILEEMYCFNPQNFTFSLEISVPEDSPDDKYLVNLADRLAKYLSTRQLPEGPTPQIPQEL